MSETQQPPIPPQSKDGVFIGKDSVYIASVLVLLALLAVSVFTGGFSSVFGKNDMQGNTSVINQASGLTDAQLKTKLEAYVDENLLSNGATAKITGISRYNDDVKLLTVDITSGGSVVATLPLYATNDGDLIIVESAFVYGLAFKTNETLPSADTETEQPEETIAKTDKPKVELYVMSFCPYGNLAEETLYPVYQTLKDSVEWDVRYIVSVNGETVRSLHGQTEVDQNIREVCVKENYDMDTYWKFIDYVNINCGSAGECWKDAATNASVNATLIEGCAAAKGLEYMTIEAAATAAAGASGSPTMFINGVQTNSVYNYGDPNAYLKVICSAFNNPPEGCKAVLEGTGSTASGSC